MSFHLFAAALTGLAGEFSSDFNSGLPPSTGIFGDALIDPAGGVNKSGVLKLTRAKPSYVGSCVIDSLDGMNSVSSFSASFKTFMGGGSGGHGFSFCLAPDLPEGSFDEKGAGSGLVISFYTATGLDDAPRGVTVRHGGETITNAPVSGLRANRFVDTAIRWDSSAGLEVTYNGQTIIAGLPLPGVSSLSGKFGFGARTTSLTDWHCIDDLTITTQPTLPAFVLSCSPADDNAAPDALIEFALRDADSIDMESVRMMLDGTEVKPAIATNEAGGKLFQYQPTTLLEPGSTHTVRVTFTQRNDPGATRSFSYRFAVSSQIAISK